MTAGASPFPSAMAGAADSAARAASPCAAARAKARAASVSMRVAPSASARRGVISRARTCSGVSDTPRASPRQRMRPASCTATACTGAPCTAMRLPTGPLRHARGREHGGAPRRVRAQLELHKAARHARMAAQPSLGRFEGDELQLRHKASSFLPGPGRGARKSFPNGIALLYCIIGRERV